jgi:hypothetical protein
LRFELSGAIKFNPQIIAAPNHPKNQRFDLAGSPVHQAT